MTDQFKPSTSHIIVLSGWQRFTALLPFRDREGRWHFTSDAERRRINVDGKEMWEKRPRDVPFDEWIDEQI